MKLFKNIGSFDKDKDGYNWMCKIVQNCAYDINKKMPDYENIEENFKKDLTNHTRIVYNIRCHCVKACDSAEKRNASDSS